MHCVHSTVAQFPKHMELPGVTLQIIPLTIPVSTCMEAAGCCTFHPSPPLVSEKGPPGRVRKHHLRPAGLLLAPFGEQVAAAKQEGFTSRKYYKCGSFATWITFKKLYKSGRQSLCPDPL